MGRFQHMVTLRINNRAFLLCVRTPEQENHAFPMLVNQADDFIGKCFPSKAGVRMCLTGANGEYGVE